MKFSNMSTTWLRRWILTAIAFALVAAAGPAFAQSHPRLAKGKYPVKVETAPPGATASA